MTTEQKSISIIEPVKPAFERIKLMLFNPFDMGKWFVIGFCAWLANMANGGWSGNLSQRFNQNDLSLHNIKDFILTHLLIIIPIILAFGILIIALWLVLTWLSSRGKFMFLHCVAENKAEVKAPWAKFQQHGNSLFLFKIVLDIIAFAAIIIPIVIAVLLVIFASKTAGELTFTAITGLCLIVLSIILIAIVVLVVQKLTTDFAIPIMALRTKSCVEAWRQFLPLLSTNKAHFTLYILFQIVIAMAVGVIILAAILVTCCCACCFLIIPYIGTVLLLPIFIFQRAYSLYYLAQFGPQFDCFITQAEST